MFGRETPFPRVDGSLTCGSIPVQDLAERFGTPLFVYSFDFIRNRYELLQETFAEAKVLLAYSVKANGNLALLNRLAALGAGADIVSGGELFDRIKEINPRARVLLSRGYSIDGRASEIMQRGCNGFIQKPFNIEQITRNGGSRVDIEMKAAGIAVEPFPRGDLDGPRSAFRTESRLLHKLHVPSQSDDRTKCECFRILRNGRPDTSLVDVPISFFHFCESVTDRGQGGQNRTRAASARNSIAVSCT